MKILEKVIEGNSTKNIIAIINKLQVSTCRQVLVEYLEQCDKNEKELSTVERNFYNGLINELTRLCTDLYLTSAFDHEKLLIEIICEGRVGYSEYELCECLDAIKSKPSDEASYKIIKHYMEKAAVYAENKDLVEKKKLKETLEADIKKYEQYIADCTEKLARLFAD